MEGAVLPSVLMGTVQSIETVGYIPPQLKHIVKKLRTCNFHSNF